LPGRPDPVQPGPPRAPGPLPRPGDRAADAPAPGAGEEPVTPAIEVDRLVKRYPRGRSNAIDDVSFTVRRGELFGLLGPNGAGKTTAIGILTTRVLPTGGRAAIAGVDVVADPIGARRRIGVVPQSPNLDRSLRVGEILTYHAAYHGVPRRDR